MSAHTVKAFDEDLDLLRALVCEMGGRTEAAIGAAIDALVRRDEEMAAGVVANDTKIDALGAEVERQGVCLIALRAPMADDLREVLTALKISTSIERMGDYARNIARRVPHIHDHRSIEPLAILAPMARAATEMVRLSLNAYVARDAGTASEICDADRVVDDYYDSFFRALLTHMMGSPHTITTSTHLLFIAQNLERIADLATNVAEEVYFAATAERLPDRITHRAAVG